jgi:hypothetical protein
LAGSLRFSRVLAGFPGRLRPHGPSCRQLTNCDALSPHATAEKCRGCDKLMTSLAHDTPLPLGEHGGRDKDSNWRVTSVIERPAPVDPRGPKGGAR